MTDELLVDYVIERALTVDDLGRERWLRLARSYAKRWMRRKGLPRKYIRTWLELHPEPAPDTIWLLLWDLLDHEYVELSPILLDMVRDVRGRRLTVRSPYNNEATATYADRLRRFKQTFKAKAIDTYTCHASDTEALRTLQRTLYPRTN